jgi:hypothetical protein
MDLRPKMGDAFVSSTDRGIAMGDKSPKSKDKARKQDEAGKKQRDMAAKAKMPMSASPGKIGR